MQKKVSALGVSLLAAGAIGLAGTTLAAESGNGAHPRVQQSAPAATTGGASASQEQVPDKTLKSFAAAATEIQSINEKARARLSDPGTAANPEDMKRKANDEIVKAVRDEGLTVETFNEIARKVQRDPELHSRVVAMMQEKNM